MGLKSSNCEKMVRNMMEKMTHACPGRGGVCAVCRAVCVLFSLPKTLFQSSGVRSRLTMMKNPFMSITFALVLVSMLVVMDPCFAAKDTFTTSSSSHHHRHYRYHNKHHGSARKRLTTGHSHIRPISILANSHSASESTCIKRDGSLDIDCVLSTSPVNNSHTAVYNAIQSHSSEHQQQQYQRTEQQCVSGSSRPKLTKKAAFLSIFLPWLYFVGGALNVPTLPRYVNYAISPDGDSKVSKLGAQVFGNINGIDSFFTFLSVNLIGVLSDLYGRKGFMVFSTIGLGVSHLLMSFAHVPSTFYIAACIDGISSCMLSQSQAYISDLQSDSDNKNIGIALSRFQGVAIGLAYMIGIPLGAIISKAYSNRTPLQVSFAVCIINAILIGLFLPLPPSSVPIQSEQQNESTDTTATTTTLKKKRIDWKQANPFGAINLFVRNKRMLLLGFIYFLINFAHSTLQVNWINYLQYRYQWSAQLSGSTLMIVGLFVAILPSYFVPFFGKLNAIKYSLLMHSMIVAFLGWNKIPSMVFATLPILAIGASSLPMLLGYLTEQVPSDEVGSLQGAADTLRTISAMVGAPLAAKIFAHFIGEDRNFPEGALYFTSIFSMIGFLFFHFMV